MLGYISIRLYPGAKRRKPYSLSQNVGFGRRNTVSPELQPCSTASFNWKGQENQMPSNLRQTLQNDLIAQQQLQHDQHIASLKASRHLDAKQRDFRSSKDESN
jgi:hypothetical protein